MKRKNQSNEEQQLSKKLKQENKNKICIDAFKSLDVNIVNENIKTIDDSTLDILSKIHDEDVNNYIKKNGLDKSNFFFYKTWTLVNIKNKEIKIRRIKNQWKYVKFLYLGNIDIKNSILSKLPKPIINEISHFF